MRITENYVLFWESEFSNFFPYDTKEVKVGDVKPLNIEGYGKKFPTSEHFFMWLKAKTFKDDETADLILQAVRPEQAKKLGRQIKGFDKDVWNEKCEEAMFTAVYSKFSQNKELRNFILDKKFNGKHFVEASPFDKIWGIGLHWSDKNAEDETKWRGENKLGKILDRVREKLSNEE